MPTPRELTDGITTAYNAHRLSRLEEFFRPDFVLITPDGRAEWSRADGGVPSCVPAGLPGCEG